MRGFRFRSSLISDPREKFFLAASPLVSSAFGRRHVGLRPTRHPPKAPRRTREKTSGTQGSAAREYLLPIFPHSST